MSELLRINGTYTSVCMVCGATTDTIDGEPQPHRCRIVTADSK